MCSLIGLGQSSMGGAVSAGHNNDELVDHLCEDDYISTPAVERVRVQMWGVWRGFCNCLCIEYVG